MFSLASDAFPIASLTPSARRRSRTPSKTRMQMHFVTFFHSGEEVTFVRTHEESIGSHVHWKGTHIARRKQLQGVRNEERKDSREAENL
jgi:hypothetical protein